MKSKKKLIKKIKKLDKDSVKNFDFYFDVIKEDQWWDYDYMLKLWDKKFEQMECNWKEAHYVGSEEELITIKRARKLLKKLIEGNFEKDLYNKFIEKYPKAFKKLSKPLTEEQSKEFNVYVSVGNIKKELVKDEFFQLVKDNYEKWWD